MSSFLSIIFISLSSSLLSGCPEDDVDSRVGFHDVRHVSHLESKGSLLKRFLHRASRKESQVSSSLRRWTIGILLTQILQGFLLVFDQLSIVFQDLFGLFDGPFNLVFSPGWGTSEFGMKEEAAKERELIKHHVTWLLLLFMSVSLHYSPAVSMFDQEVGTPNLLVILAWCLFGRSVPLTLLGVNVEIVCLSCWSRDPFLPSFR